MTQFNGCSPHDRASQASANHATVTVPTTRRTEPSAHTLGISLRRKWRTSATPWTRAFIFGILSLDHQQCMSVLKSKRRAEVPTPKKRKLSCRIGRWESSADYALNRCPRPCVGTSPPHPTRRNPPPRPTSNAGLLVAPVPQINFDLCWG